jgi:SulP family sulfate permease
VLAGLSVALVLIPQAMAYAELAGLPSQMGLYASALPLVAAAVVASSPYLQGGPVALTAILTFGALVPLAEPGSAEFIGLAGLLALVVGVTRMLIGLLGAGWLIYLISRPMMSGFLSAAAIVIVAAQLPDGLGSVTPDRGVLVSAGWALAHPGSWDPWAVSLTALTILLVGGAQKIHPLVPGVLLAALVGLALSLSTGLGGPTVGDIPSGLPPLTLALPWSRLPQLVVPGAVIALVGFADASSISRLFASEERQKWDADREFLSGGVANVVAAFSGGIPVGGSLSRSSINRMAGARSRWSGLVTGLTVLLFLPFASVLSPLPHAVLSGIVIASIWGLFRPRELARLWQASPPQAVVGWGTFALTLLLAPHIEQAVLMGVVVASAVHMWRELTPGVRSWREGDTLYVAPSGVLWFGSAPAMEDRLLAQLAAAPDVKHVVIRCGGLGRIDFTGAATLHELLEQARRIGLRMTLEDVPAHAHRILAAVGAIDGAAGPVTEDVSGTPTRPMS